MFPYFTHTQYTTSPAVPTFLLHLHVRGNLVDTFEMDSQEDLDLVVAHAKDVRGCGRAERALNVIQWLYWWWLLWHIWWDATLWLWYLKSAVWMLGTAYWKSYALEATYFQPFYLRWHIHVTSLTYHNDLVLGSSICILLLTLVDSYPWLKLGRWSVVVAGRSVWRVTAATDYIRERSSASRLWVKWKKQPSRWWSYKEVFRRLNPAAL
jgi:hypothetical protein